MKTESIPSQATEAVDRLPQRRPASLYDVAVQYSIFDWYETVTSGDLDFDLSPEHLAFMTPAQKDGLLGESDNALVVYVDLSDPENPSFRDSRPVAFETVDASMRYKLGHAYPQNKTSSLTDYSITTHKSASEWHLAGQRDDTWGTNNIKDRFTDWAHSDAANRVLDREGIDNKWILEALQQIGDQPGRIDDLVDRGDVPLDPEDQETEHEVFVTVRVKLPDESRYRWPGEIPILNEVMMEQKSDRLDNISVENASNEGVGYIDNNKEWVTGGSAGLLGMYGKQQREHFPDLSPDGSQAWRNRPLSRERAAAVATANSVFEQFFEGLGDSRRLYVLPYLAKHPDKISPAEFDAFVRDTFIQLRNREDSSFQAKVNEIFYNREDSDIEPLFSDAPSTPTYDSVEVATVFQVTGEPDRIFFETLQTDVYRPRAVDKAHDDVLTETVFWGNGIFADIRDRSESPLLSPGDDRTVMSLFGRYFDWTTEPTRNSMDVDGEPKAGDIDGIRSRRLMQFLQGEQIPVRTLIEEYLHLLVQTQREQFGDEEAGGVPDRQVAEQYAQLRALADIDALGDGQQVAYSGIAPEPTHSSTFATVTETASDTYHNREQRLEDFISTHEVLSNSKPHQAVFLLGGLVGRITAYQHREGVSSTLVRRYPIDYLTKQSIKEVTNEVIQMNNTYIEASDSLPSTYNARYTERLPDLMLEMDPSSWQLTQNEIQWIYALGITYGSNDTKIETTGE